MNHLSKAGKYAKWFCILVVCGACGGGLIGGIIPDPHENMIRYYDSDWTVNYSHNTFENRKALDKKGINYYECNERQEHIFAGAGTVSALLGFIPMILSGWFLSLYILFQVVHTIAIATKRDCREACESKEQDQ